jgi:hypothetical protein
VTNNRDGEKPGLVLLHLCVNDGEKSLFTLPAMSHAAMGNFSLSLLPRLITVHFHLAAAVSCVGLKMELCFVAFWLEENLHRCRLRPFRRPLAGFGALFARTMNDPRLGNR